MAVELNQLADLVLQCVDPTKTEHLLLGPGGICTDLSNTAQWPARELRDAEVARQSDRLSRELELSELKEAYKEKHRKCQAWEKVQSHQ